MELDKNLKTQLKEKYGSLKGFLRHPFLDHNAGILLQDNELLKEYLTSARVTNHFLRGVWDTMYSSNFDPDQTEFQFTIDKINHDFNKNKLIRQIQHGKLPKMCLNHMPITTAFIKYLIEIDEMFRLSKLWTKKAEIYRGSVSIRSLDMTSLNSWSEDREIAWKFTYGSNLYTTIPSGFPYIIINDTQPDNYCNSQENEYLLPPCDFEVLKSTRGFHRGSNDGLGSYDAEVILRPRNLAKVFLERMKNPPKDYPKAFLTDPDYEYEKSMKMLEQYIEKYVDKKKIRLGGRILKEPDDPEIVFPSEMEK